MRWPAIGLGLALCGVVWAQPSSYCNITGVKAERLSNGVAITIQSDGIMQVRSDISDYIDFSAVGSSDSSTWLKALLVLPFRITNARSRIGSVADIGVYPASHVEFAVPSDSVDGLGLDVKVNLLTEAYVVTLRTGGSGFEFGSGPAGKPTVRIQQTQDQRDLIIIVTSDHRTQEPVEHAAAPEGSEKRMTVAAHEGRLDIEALDVDFRELVRQLSAKGGRPVVADDSLVRSVSLLLTRVTLMEALEALALTYGLTVDDSGEIIHVVDALTRDLPALRANTFLVVPLNYITAATARGSLPEFLLQYVHVDPEKNALIVSGPPELAAKLRDDIAKLDKPVAQIELVAEIVEFVSSEDLDASGLIRDRWQSGYLKVDSTTGDVRYVFSGTNPKKFRADLTALLTSGKARVRAKPSMTVSSGHSASLFAGTQKLVKVRYFNSDVWAYDNKLLTINLGVGLDVTAWCTGDGVITAKVTPSVTSVESVDAAGFPTVARRNATATLRLQNGETVYIGGVTQHTNSRTKRTLPLLGDVLDSPKRSWSKSELAIFLTARKVPGSTDAAGAATTKDGRK